MRNPIVCLLILVLCTSCAHVISQVYRESAVQDVPFRKILQSPSAFIGKIFILGGMIAETRNIQEGTEIEVVQTPLDRFGYLIDRDVSEGRFLVITQKQLDPLIYKEGRYITFAGILIGSRTKPLGNIEFDYPLFEVKELHLWKNRGYYRHYYYDPYYYDPFYYPYPYGYYWYWPGYYYPHRWPGYYYPYRWPYY